MMMMKTVYLMGACIALMASTISAAPTMAEVQATMDSLALRMGKLEAALDEKIMKEGMSSAFLATNKNILAVSAGQKVVFPDVPLCHGLKGYDETTGVYTVPADGLYQFQARVTINCKDCVFIGYIKTDKTTLAGIGVHDKNYYDGMTVSTLAELKTGDKVYLHAASLQGGAKVYHYTFSSFSGVLLEAY